ncbi:jg11541 [Pararge aegeria aegeria]|uniref:Jg11541 protein n=1 Tax=Pararge aegeria aegeria TaxID=348720 RepID=A0A8S4RL67_9NEOP|nr:jg11541 [Pararge aegeria aegeria]
MKRITLIVFAAVVAMALAEGQYYVPRAYYIIDAEGHASPPVPLRRLRRSLNPYPLPYASGATANANANAEAQGWGGNANANANAHAVAGSRGGGAGGWELPAWNYGSSNPNTLRH